MVKARIQRGSHFVGEFRMSGDADFLAAFDT
jgi:hypothetical protein